TENWAGGNLRGDESMEFSCPSKRSSLIAVGDTDHVFLRGSYNNHVRGLYDFYLVQRTETAICINRVIYLFGGHQARDSMNNFYVLDSKSMKELIVIEGQTWCLGIKKQHEVMPGLTASMKMNGYSLIIPILKNQDYGIVCASDEEKELFLHKSHKAKLQSSHLLQRNVSQLVEVTSKILTSKCKRFDCNGTSGCEGFTDGASDYLAKTSML
ncbi:Kelch domain-containing protein 2, partial [Galemys pyrenaicus]